MNAGFWRDRPTFVTGGSGLLGSWLVKATLGFSRDALERSYVVEVLSGATQLAATRVVPGRQEFLEVSLEFTLESSFESGAMLEIRVHNERAALDGYLALGEVLLIPRTQPAYNDIRGLIRIIQRVEQDEPIGRLQDPGPDIGLAHVIKVVE